MSDSGQKKRKSKGWYRKQAFHNNKRIKTDFKPGHSLVAGLKGFIVTSNNHERDAVRESYNILNEYAEKLYGPETLEEEDGSDEDDIEKAIAKEVQTLKDTAASGQRRFQNCQTGAKNCIFIKTTLEDPAALAQAIFTDLLATKVQKSRYALRLLPVVGTCKANLTGITELAKEVLKPFFTDTKFQVTYSILFKARNNSGLGREMTISSLRRTIEEAFPSVLLHYTCVNPQVTILIEVICGVACIAVAKEFSHFRKYNLVEVTQQKEAPDVEDKDRNTANETNTAEQVSEKDEGANCEQDAPQESIKMDNSKPSPEIVLPTTGPGAGHGNLEQTSTTPLSDSTTETTEAVNPTTEENTTSPSGEEKRPSTDPLPAEVPSTCESAGDPSGDAVL